MGYYEFNISIPNDSIDALMEKLSELGCLGIIAGDNSLTVYFPDEIYVEKVKKELHSFRKTLRDAGLPNALSYEYQFISDIDWNESWKKNFKPLDIGEKLTILPPWEETKPNRINIIIDPGMAFGTGHHETTKRCLILIEKLSKEKPFKESFLDIGTGTGILAILASKLGFKYVLGLDIDPLAIDAAKRNIELNGLKNIEIECSKLENIKGNFDFIVANLFADTLISLAPDIASLLNIEGILILSGIIEGRENDIIKVYERNNINFLERFIDINWITLVGNKL